MPPKRTADTSSGQKRKRGETKKEKLAKVKAEWEEKKKQEQAENENNDDDAEEEVEDEETPAKKAKINPKEGGSGTSGTRRKESVAATRSSSRKKDPPSVAKTPPRSAATAKKKPADRSLFSPNPTGSGSKAPPPKDDDEEEDDTIPAPIPLPDLPSAKAADAKDGPGLRPVSAKKEELPEEEGRAVAATAAKADGNEDPDEDDEDSPYETDSSYDEEDDEANRLLNADQYQRQDDPRLDPSVPKKRSLFWMLAETAVTAFLCLSLITYVFPSTRRLIPTLWEPGPVPTVCFRDSPHSQGEQVIKIVAACRDNDETPVVWQNCPSDAYCRGGSLLQCPDGFAADPQGCILTEASNETLKAMIGLLQSWTAQDICKGHPENRARRQPRYDCQRGIRTSSIRRQ